MKTKIMLLQPTKINLNSENNKATNECTEADR